MSCASTKGRSLPCKSSVGGLKNVFILDYSTAIAALTDSAGTITLPSDGSAEFFKYEIKGNSSLETAVNSSRENGTTFYETTLNVTLTTIDVATQEEIKLLNRGRAHYVVEDYNGNFRLFGQEHGCEVQVNSTTGQAMGDLNGYNLTVSSQEREMAYYVDASLVGDVAGFNVIEEA